MALIVQKYGGTSVGSTERIRNVARRVAHFHSHGHQLVVVPSAMSGETNRLLALATAAEAAGVPVALIAHACQADGPCLKLATDAEPAAAFARTMSRAERYRRPTPAA